MKRGKGAETAIALALVANIFPPLAALATTPIIARSLGVGDTGAVVAATAPLILLANALTLGIPEAIVYFTARNPDASRATARRA